MKPAVPKSLSCLCVVGLLGLSLSCGNDVPTCPTGSCDLPGSTVIKWKFNSYPDLNFDSDACTELAVSKVRVELVGIEDPTVVETADTNCGEAQHTFIDLPVQNYAVGVTPLDVDGNSLVTMPAMGSTPAGTTGASVTLTVNVQFELWMRQYTGQFLYRIKWGGQTCMAATPVVKTQIIKLTAGGSVTNLTNTMNQTLDGTENFVCYEFTEQFPQNVMNLPFGPATIEIRGVDVNSLDKFKQTFDTFIGAGNFNPTLTYDVQAIDAAVAPSDI